MALFSDMMEEHGEQIKDLHDRMMIQAKRAVQAEEDRENYKEQMIKAQLANYDLKAEVRRLRAALDPIADFSDWPERGDHEMTAMRVTFGHLRALRVALALPPAKSEATETKGPSA